MSLNIIGIGLADEKDITVKGLELVKKSDVIYLESYTSKLAVPVSALERFYGKKVELADRKLVEIEAEENLLKPAKTKEITLLVIGDALSATTHIDLIQRAVEMKINTNVVHNASVLTAIGATGLQLYKFGKVASIPFTHGDYEPDTPYAILTENQSIGAHTLFLLDLKPDENKFMTANDALRYLQKLEIKQGKGLVKDNTLVVGCARLGAKDQLIFAGKAKDVIKKDFGAPVHCLIIPGKLHFVEEDALRCFQ
ncbi:diphthine synthase [Candidatus Woesearchaeota archaeon]|nr:diphthine synthase [Candidatus Woesearchaeota archaeon]